MKSDRISKHIAVIFLTLLPLAAADGFKDHQLQLGHDNGEYRLIKWLNKFKGSDRSSSQSASRFDPIKIEKTTPEILYDASNFTQNETLDSSQLAQVTYPSVPLSPDDTSSSKSSFHSVETQGTRPFVSSVSSPSYKDYFYLKWFHGSPKATYFNETMAVDKPTPSVIDSKTEHGRHPAVEALPAMTDSSVTIGNQGLDLDSVDLSDAELVSSDSLLGKVLDKIKQMMPVKTQKLDYAPLKLYDEPPKPQLTRPKGVHFPPTLAVHSNAQQVSSQPIEEGSLPVVPVQPVHDERSPAINQPSLQQVVISPPENSRPQPEETSSTSLLEQHQSSKEYDTDDQPAEPSFTPASVVASSNVFEQKDGISERMSVDLKPIFYYPKQLINNPVQPEEPAYNAFKLAFSPLVPAYP